MAGERDDFQHPVEDHPQWSESYYFNFFDSSSGVGGITRIGVRPNEGTMDGGFLMYLPGGRVAFQHLVIPSEENTDVLDVLGVSYERVEPMRTWRLSYAGQALVVDDPRLLADVASLFASSPPFEKVEMALTFEALHQPYDTDDDPRMTGSSEGPAAGRPGPLGAAFGGIGHYDQAGTYGGRVCVGGREWALEAFGVRDHTWGVRDWRSPEMWRFFSMAFGSDLVLSASRIVIDGRDLRGGWVLRDGVTSPVVNMELETDYGADGLAPKAVRLTLVEHGGSRIEVAGEALTVVPVKMEGGATLVHECLTRFACGPRVGYGISEFLQQA